jgi:hypothetical protein
VGYLAVIMANTAGWGFIDPLSALQQARVWLMSAQNDTVVAHSVVAATAALYDKFLASPTCVQAGWGGGCCDHPCLVRVAAAGP